MLAQGTGKNPNNPSDKGWDTGWNDSLPATSGVLANALRCSSDHSTWSDTAGVGDNLPINCLTWFEAEAFCTWDGGRLPTEAEWNYAAAGGTSQRIYPWGSARPTCSYANYFGGNNGKDYCTEPPFGYFNNVGKTSPLGDGAYGQADLSGNVIEWVQDWYVTPYPTPCNNCYNSVPTANRAIRSTSIDDTALGLISSSRYGQPPTTRLYAIGARCAR